ncbi:hypothetical protein FJY94_01290 [Candidatus Kaiserbacteria bacterium]|nr:hypothetical protein [Candidatus Kaiserbacteria bacterium]
MFAVAQHRRAQYAFSLVMCAVVIAWLAFVLTSQPQSLQAATAVPIRGWAWSDTIGWIDLHCQNTGICATRNFGLSVDSVSGVVTGYAWSEHIGWVSANSADLSGCPTAPCEARISGTAPNMTVTGWLRATAATAAENGGWDGFIRLSSTGHADGVTYNSTTGQFSGYAWGSTNVGWVSFTGATTTYLMCTPSYTCAGNTIMLSDSSCISTAVTTCTTPAFCFAGSSVCLYPPPTAVPSTGSLTGHLQIKPALVARSATAKLYWNIENVSSCTVTGSNGSDSWTGATSTASGRQTSAITSRVDYTLSCTALDGSSFQESATVNVVPVYRET